LYKYICFLLIYLCLTANNESVAQDPLPSFGAPLDIPLYLSGNFAELRRNHFHTGIDFKTQGVEGHKILAAEDGFVSRISVSPYGYGLALYIQHPNGYTTVYGHLLSFSENIADVVRKKQYEEKSFSVNFNPDPPIQVARGEVVALSGNTGSSGGPHLHFEIRDTKTEKPQNPLLFGFDVKDNIPPRIRGVRFHPLADTTLINGKHEARSFVVLGNAGKYHLKAGIKINVYGAFGLSLHTRDYLNDQPNHCGIYTLALNVNDALICAQRFDELDFATSRNINSYKDYEVFKNNQWHYHKSYVEPGNKLEIYHPKPLNNGIISIPGAGVHQVDYTVTDAYGNESRLSFEFETPANPGVPLPSPRPYDAYFGYGKNNHFEYSDELEISIPENALYQDLRFEFSRQMRTQDTYSPVYILQNEDVPLQEFIEIKFFWKDVAKSIRDKILVQRSDIKGRTSYLTGSYTPEYFIVKARDFGKFTLVADTTVPSLTAGRWSTGGTVTNASDLQFTMRDDRSGIKAYNAYLNGEWVLLKYEPKKSMVFLNVGESNFQKGNNSLVIKIEDGVGNETVQTFEYNY